MPRPTIFLNDVDLSALGFAVRDVANLWHGASVTGDGTRVPGRPGQLAPTALKRAIEPRTLDIVGTLIAPTRADLLERLDFLKTICHAAALTIVFAETEDRYFTGRLAPGGIAVSPTGPAFLARKVPITISLICDDPFAYDVDPQVLDFDATLTAVELGSEVSTGTVKLLPPPGGTAVNPVLSLYYPNGDLKESLGFTVTLDDATDDFLAIDLATFLITHSVNGVESDGLNLQTSGDLSAFILSPNDVADPADLPGVIKSASGRLYLTDAWPQIAVNHGTGELTYRREWS